MSRCLIELQLWCCFLCANLHAGLRVNLTGPRLLKGSFIPETADSVFPRSIGRLLCLSCVMWYNLSGYFPVCSYVLSDKYLSVFCVCVCVCVCARACLLFISQTSIFCFVFGFPPRLKLSIYTCSCQKPLWSRAALKIVHAASQTTDLDTLG